MAGLIITNGDSAAELLVAAGRQDTICPWRDVLHEGPVVTGRLEECSARRADYLAQRFSLDSGEVEATFAERDDIIRNHKAFDRIELWFEHDLYDQLQLIQILSVLADEDRSDEVVLVQAGEFLGHQRPDTILRFAQGARQVRSDDFELATQVWSALAMPRPAAVVRHTTDTRSDWPFLRPALLRFLEELPGANGLSRTEATALSAIADGVTAPLRLFPHVLAREEAAFMGDLSFFAILEDLARAGTPLIEGFPLVGGADDEVERLRDATLSLTEAGRAVLEGDKDHISLNGVDRWWAGTRLAGRDVWRFERGEMRLVPPQASAA